MTGMKAKTIKMVLRRKIRNWLDTIEDESVRVLAAKNTMITGGSIASMLLGEEINDYDVYFLNIDTAEAIAKYYVDVFNRDNKLKSVNEYKPFVAREHIANCKGIVEERIVIRLQSAGVIGEEQTEYEYFEQRPDSIVEASIESLENSPETVIEELSENISGKKPYRPVFMSDNAISLANDMQLIIRFYGMPVDIHRNFDFVHATSYYVYSEDFLVLPRHAMEALMSKTLVYVGSLYPIASLFRIRKFLGRGFRITAGQMLKIIWQVSELNLKDETVLREQLIGVDQAYMHQLIEELSKATPSERADAAYIAQLIDKLFET